MACAIASCVASYVVALHPRHSPLRRLGFARHSQRRMSQKPTKRQERRRDLNRRRCISFPAKTRVSALPVTLLSGSSWTVTAVPIPLKSSGARAARTFVLGPLSERKAWQRNAFAVGNVNGTSMPLRRTGCALIDKHKRQRQRTDIMKLKPLGGSEISWRPLYKSTWGIFVTTECMSRYFGTWGAGAIVVKIE